MARGSRKKAEDGESSESTPKKTLYKSLMDLHTSTEFSKGGQSIKTGVLPFDEIFGGAMPLGRMIELASMEGVGKTTLLCTVASFLAKKGRRTLYIDAEHALDRSLIRGVGITDKEYGDLFIVNHCRTFRDLSDLMEYALMQDITMVVCDSMTSVMHSKLMTMNVEDVEPGLQARAQSALCQKFKGEFYRQGVTFIFITQMRTKIRFKGPSTIEAAGGTALKFYADVRVGLNRDGILERQDEKGLKYTYGADVSAASAKNKIVGMQPPVKMTILYGRGVSNVMYIMRRLQDIGMCEQSSSYFKFNSPIGEQTVQGREAAMLYVKEHYKDLAGVIFQNRGVGVNEVNDDEEEENG